MGLDQYFEARKSHYESYSRYEQEQGLEDKTNYPENLKVLTDYISNRNFKSRIIEERYEIGYFRKFNALHNYIIENFADGIDNCQRIWLGKERISTLLDTLTKVDLDHSLAEELLPCVDGCFFGSQEYDDWYFNEVKEAIKLCNLILENLDFNEYDIIYQASW